MIDSVPELLYGDCLLYGGSSLLDWAIYAKTWSPVCHVEVYTRDEKSVASRNGKGVAMYPFRHEDLKFVLRPKGELSKINSFNYFHFVDGQAYDWLGLLCFTLAVAQGSPNKQFCSEFATNFYRAGGFDPFNPWWPADKIAPGNFLMSPSFKMVWKAE